MTGGLSLLHLLRAAVAMQPRGNLIHHFCKDWLLVVLPTVVCTIYTSHALNSYRANVSLIVVIYRRCNIKA